jgi:hypothetical protein
MCVRHVAEQEDRIARQDILVERLRESRSALLDEALRLLTEMRRFLDAMHDHVARLSTTPSSRVRAPKGRGPARTCLDGPVSGRDTPALVQPVGTIDGNARRPGPATAGAVERAGAGGGVAGRAIARTSRARPRRQSNARLSRLTRSSPSRRMTRKRGRSAGADG